MMMKFKVFLCGFLMVSLMLTIGCTKDKDIKAQITGLAKSDVNFAGIEYSVSGKVVTLTGKCPSLKAKEEVENTIKSIKVINGIDNKIQLSPVILDSGFDMKLAVDSVLSAYPTVTADVTGTHVILKGEVKSTDLAPLLKGIDKLNPKNLKNQLVAD